MLSNEQQLEVFPRPEIILGLGAFCQCCAILFAARAIIRGAAQPGATNSLRACAASASTHTHTHTPLRHALPTHRLTMPTQFSRVPAQLADAPVLPATRARPRDYRWRRTRPLSVNRHVSY